MNKSFTLIEILTVILIVGILSGIIIVVTNNVLDSTQDAKRKKDLDSISKALMEYGIMTGSYPVEASDCDIGDGTCLDELIDSGYTTTFPLDPDGTRYKYSSDGTTYTIKTVLSDNQTLAYSPDTGYSQYTGLVGYTKRKSITINSSASLTDYQVKVDVTYDSDMQADFDDIRFTLSNGATELSYWLESKTDSSTATFWVKIPSIPSGDSTIYAYYGNASASSASNGDNTFEFFDHFEGSSLNGSKWTSSGTVSVSSSIVTVNNILNSTWEGIGTTNTFTKNYAARALLKSSNWGNTGMWTGFDFATGSNEVNCRYSAPSGNGGGTYMNYDGALGSTNILGWSASVYHIQDIKLDSSAAVFSVDNSNNVTLSSHYPSSGNMTLWIRVRKTSGAGETMYCDWVFIRKYSGTEPTISSWGSEESI